MKKLLLIIVLCLMWSGSAYASLFGTTAIVGVVVLFIAKFIDKD